MAISHKGFVGANPSRITIEKQNILQIGLVVMKKSDFWFYKKDEEYECYWFYVYGETKFELTDRHMEQSMVSVTEVVYSKTDDIVAVVKFFPFNTMVVYDRDPDLKKILLDLVRNVDKDVRGVESAKI